MTPTSEFSHIVTVEPWPADGISVDLKATDGQRRRLRERFDLVDLTLLNAKGTIAKASDGLIFDGWLEAEVVQTCVATLKPVPALVKTSFKRRYRLGETGSALPRQGEVVLDDDNADIDLLDQDHIDVGEVIAEEFYLALDPYPRAEDADIVMAEIQGSVDGDAVALPDSPFAKLRRH